MKVQEASVRALQWFKKFHEGSSCSRSFKQVQGSKISFKGFEIVKWVTIKGSVGSRWFKKFRAGS